MTAEPSMTATPLRVLLLDDDPDFRAMARLVLAMRGYDVAAFADGQSAWDACRADPFPLVLLDWSMPPPDGLEVCRRIRTLPAGDDAVVLVMTGRTAPSALASVLDAGADDYLAKPFGVDLLDLRLTIAERLIDARRERREAQDERLRLIAAAAAADAAARLAAIVESSNDAVVGSSPDGRITSWNPAAERLFGYPAADILGHPLSVLVPPELDAEESAIQAAIRRGDRIDTRETVRLGRGNHRLDVALTDSPIVAIDGTIVGASTIARDIGAQKKAAADLRDAKDAAEAASHTKSAFLSTMSHELRTPLTAILGYADLLLEGFDGDLTPLQSDDVARIAAGAQRLLRLINDLLDLARIESGRLDLEPEPVDLASVLAEVREDVAPQAAAKGLALAVEAAPGLPTVVADRQRLRQVLLNLAGNAVKFTECGSVSICARADGHGVEIAVVDTGIGIPAGAHEIIFDEFRQADGSTTRRYGGSGLGLAISRKLLAMHDGRIRVESVPGQGSKFAVWLPAAPTDADPVASG